MTFRLHRGDLPDGLTFSGAVAIDTETLGLKPHRDRLCLVQISGGDGNAELVQILPGQTRAPNLEALLRDRSVQKLFHFARFDVAVLFKTFNVMPEPVWCTKIASRLVRTYTDRHGLKDLVRELLGTDISKQQQSSDWGAETLTEAQLAYAASDVLYLHQLKEKLEVLLQREGRTALADACFAFLPIRAALDLTGFEDQDIFSHS
ncbi:ribonuclease D [Terrihabitans rhizophilus]|jgi:ribonuclease D|uniref:Ribonuclease D n=1 Tax=Terrihabitans rhizophilus TaxID=3092662 RepID=A0ABU4RPA1_9HYPH|nr:ribonuclease D [Terrihabitans sp. PJ23]MDX6804571.1 ribonuclease D [Terrihabitans sp. PJ23]